MQPITDGKTKDKEFHDEKPTNLTKSGIPYIVNSFIKKTRWILLISSCLAFSTLLIIDFIKTKSELMEKFGDERKNCLLVWYFLLRNILAIIVKNWESFLRWNNFALKKWIVWIGTYLYVNIAWNSISYIINDRFSGCNKSANRYFKFKSNNCYSTVYNNSALEKIIN